MLKFGQTYIIDPLCKLFNNISSTGKFPVVWAKGIIVPIFKSGEKCNTSNYKGTRERPFNLKGGGGGGYGFFQKKYSDSQCCWKKYSDFGEGKKNNMIQSFCHITYCWILEKKNSRFAWQKKNILTLVLSEKKFWTKQKTITPPPPLFKLNGRSLTISSCIGKLFLKILNNRLDNFRTMHNIICPEQIGFSKGSRTSDHMFVLKTLIDKHTQQGSKHLYTCFVDFRKAFDTVWHIGLLYILRNSGVSDLFYNIIKNMYENTLLSVKVNNTYLTDNFQSFVGVRQGDNLSHFI